jgi:hypothetical protein
MAKSLIESPYGRVSAVQTHGALNVSIFHAFKPASGTHEDRAADERGFISPDPEATMPALSTWNLDQTHLLTLHELPRCKMVRLSQSARDNHRFGPRRRRG